MLRGSDSQRLDSQTQMLGILRGLDKGLDAQRLRFLDSRRLGGSDAQTLRGLDHSSDGPIIEANAQTLDFPTLGHSIF